MGPIMNRERVRDAVARALLLDPSAGKEAAIRAAAQALGLAEEVVRDTVAADEVSA